MNPDALITHDGGYPYRLARAYAGSAEISVYVDAHCRRRGLAAALLDQAARSAPTLGISILLEFIFGHNEPSLQLFVRAGYERWGLLPGVARLDGIERDLVLMGLRVRPG